MPKTMKKTVYLYHNAPRNEYDDPRGSLSVGEHKWADDNDYGYTNIASQEVEFTLREDWDPVAQALKSLDTQEKQLRADFENKMTGFAQLRNKLLAIEHTTPTDVEARFEDPTSF